MKEPYDYIYPKLLSGSSNASPGFAARHTNTVERKINPNIVRKVRLCKIIGYADSTDSRVAWNDRITWR